MTRGSWWSSLLVSVFAVASVATLASAQGKVQRAVSVRVVDSAGRSVPYAVLQLASGPVHVANDSGRATVTYSKRGSSQDSVKVLVRRIGFTPLDTVFSISEERELVAVLSPLPQNLGLVNIVARDDPLARRGFYDRMESVRRGAVSAWFMTPEEIELRNPARASHLLGGQRFVKIQWYDGRPVLTGRSGSCQLMVLLDGVRMTGMLEEAYTPDGQREIDRLGGGEKGYRLFMSARSSIDDVVNALSIQAVEVYASAASAPIALQRAAGPAPCGIVAIWTGSRSR